MHRCKSDSTGDDFVILQDTIEPNRGIEFARRSIVRNLLERFGAPALADVPRESLRRVLRSRIDQLLPSAQNSPEREALAESILQEVLMGAFFPPRSVTLARALRKNDVTDSTTASDYEEVVDVQDLKQRVFLVLTAKIDLAELRQFERPSLRRDLRKVVVHLLSEAASPWSEFLNDHDRRWIVDELVEEILEAAEE